LPSAEIFFAASSSSSHVFGGAAMPAWENSVLL
jgi:hypothetical protein